MLECQTDCVHALATELRSRTPYNSSTEFKVSWSSMPTLSIASALASTPRETLTVRSVSRRPQSGRSLASTTRTSRTMRLTPYWTCARSCWRQESQSTGPSPSGGPSVAEESTGPSTSRYWKIGSRDASKAGAAAMICARIRPGSSYGSTPSSYPESRNGAVRITGDFEEPPPSHSSTESAGAGAWTTSSGWRTRC